MKYIITLLLTFTILLSAGAQNNDGKAPTTKTEERFLTLEKQVTAQQMVLNKHKAALDSLKDVNLVLTAHKDSYSSNIEVITSVFGALLTVAVFYFGYLVPKNTRKQYALAVSKATKNLKVLEEDIKKETGQLNTDNIINRIEISRWLMYASQKESPHSDISINWALSMYEYLLKRVSFGETHPYDFKPEKVKRIALRNINFTLVKQIKTFRSFDQINKKIDQLLKKETEATFINELTSIKIQYNKLYYVSLSKNEQDKGNEPETENPDK